MSASSRNRAAKSSGKSSTARGERIQDYTAMPSVKELKLFDPCAATASMFLYAQGPTIVCCHHDTLTVETRFSRHKETVELLAVDNQSDLGGGRLVVSYDAGQTAIVWDLMTGDEVARFSSYETLTAAAWMRDGNVAFGNTQGNIILFEPTTSEHISSRTIDQIAVTALAPSADCRTFAIGYQNGSLLIATLQPRFTILHNLTTSRAPSPVVTVAWHASSSRQKSDMLAVQSHDGDLRVWSVAKNFSADDPAKVVRILRRRESSVPGPNWMGWSKNGRIIQFSDSETLSWDVRTKHVTFDSIPTLEHVKGLAVYGPGATLFTSGPNGTVQQFDLNSPSIMVANVQHPTNLLPPSPPNSIEEPSNASGHSATTIHTSESESSSVPFDIGVSESDEDQLSPFARFSRRPHLDPSGGEVSFDPGSPVSSRSGVSSVSKSSASSRTPGHYQGSMMSRGMTENTYISTGSSLKPSTIGRKDLDTYSMGYSLPSTSGQSTTSSRSRHRPSRLRHEIPRSPDDNKVHELFKFTRSRLSDIPYKHPMRADNSRLTNDDLRRQMLSTIFGWHKPIEDLIQDEMSRHPAGSASRILLAKWLGDMDTDIMVGSSENMSSSDWMLLALSGIGGQKSQHKLGRAYVRRLLENGDIHVAVTIMLGMGDHNDAIEIYISHKRYMEALILTCVVFPSVWERQAAIIRKWGEWAVQHGQQQLAIRCFACTDQESTEPWSSPSAVQLNFQSITPSIPEILSPPLSPPGLQRGPQRSVAKSSALKLITTFGDENQKSRFYSQGDGGQTPIAAGVTPIADSAISPAVCDVTTALLRPSSNSRFNTPTSARPSGSSCGRGRLPSIGEISSDLNREAHQAAEKASERVNRLGHVRVLSAEQDNLASGRLLQRAATASPMMMRDSFQKAARGYEGERPPSPNENIMSRMQEARSNRRNGSRDRIPRGVNLQLKPLGQPAFADVTPPEQSVTSSTRFHWPSRRRAPGSVASSVTSTSSAGRSLRTGQRHRDDYMHSLEAAHDYSKGNRSRGGSTERGRESSRGRHGSQEGRTNSREASEERGRASARCWTKPKRSPTSPIPMSPEDLANLSTPKYHEVGEPGTTRKSGGTKAKTGSRASSRGSQRRSPDGRPRPPALDIRGRSLVREASHQRSPSSPLPLSATASLHYQGSEDEEDFRRAIEEQEGFRTKHSRGASRTLNSPLETKGEGAESRRRETAEALGILPPMVAHTRAASTDHAGDLRQMKDERQRKKEQAARELEERRKSLAKRPQAPQILHPNEINGTGLRIGVEMMNEPKGVDDAPPRCATEPPKSMYARSGPHIGLPATPKAMRLILEAENSSKMNKDVPEVPFIPPDYGTLVVSSGQCPKKEEGIEPLTLLPSTVYQPPQRPAIPRSMSAPIPDEPRQTPRHPRKASTGGIRGMDEVVQGGRRHSQEEAVPPPPPPVPAAPPMLKELQHLATPPPPPPAPLPYAQRSLTGGALASGMIEIVMDEDDDAPIVAAPNDGMVPVLAPPAPPCRGHNRGRSNGDGSFSRGLSRTGNRERMRSASRSRKDSGASIKSPLLEMSSDGAYRVGTLRSPVGGVPPPVMYDPDAIRAAIEPNGKHMSTGLDQSEMF
ncbi:WD40/YVTN repeat-like-containing domain protein [Metarhizium album ARSEF 1941]|uniref:WD40/YVTN repeat-like-containing domain protein n=1 Tax=Metarhizium album (strain ARSEF 1941) TaxID=1081103 RepID=A0A0B2X1Z4_METAS|nr:WD40/YVTN repeat-like-containing domain protein [Metarhizium album ARSEF 1941]KHN99190.1 WD40/YVTN repeat-like-containing domain protein [Metarhizium album ARSEF 1941]